VGLLAVVLGAAVPGAAVAQLAPETAARVDSVFADLNRTDGPGCALGVVRDGQLAYGKGYGIANLDYRRPITPETNFYMASVSKHVVAAAVVVAKRKGLLSLDDPVRKWLPEFPKYGGPTITIRHLIHQTSGLRDRSTLADLAAWRFPYARPTEDYLELVYRQQGLNFEPGSAYGYSNTNYLLLAEIVGKAAGSSLREFADEHLFGPLGMRDTHFHDDRTHVVRDRAVGYAKGERGYRMSHHWEWEQVGPGGWYTNIEDLARWDRNFDTEAVGGEGFTDRMTTRGVLADGDTISYAFGLRIGEYRGLRTVEHGGSHSGGFQTHYRRFPEAEVSTFVLCNFLSANPEARSDSVANIVLADQLAPADEAQTADEEDTPPVELSPQDLQPYAGTYRRAENRQYVRFFMDGGRLAVEGFWGQYPLRPIESDRFAMEGTPVEWTFDRDEGGRPEQAVLQVSGDTTVFHRVEIASYSEAERRSFAGRYHSDELGVDYRILAKDDSLHLVQNDRDPVPLRPGIENEFRFEERKVLQFQREDDTVTGFTVSTPRAAGIRFKRTP
jgi:CubicO group peptidase (beta-lactamase class C family)